MNKTIAEEIRCGCCHKKLAEGWYVELRIKCPRCSAMNAFVATSPRMPASVRDCLDHRRRQSSKP
ncbi:Com family DNA-binding transcriptional regulator [Chromobacterium haemolyticum]|uniref:Com family DNA-binding transcriptional regulator n=1 Tax=Chromobacterium haemolyticum TaxID=394935 RepID=A0ABS3GJ23_9NEIS|nr:MULTISPECIES: Com family DNA-binding transcriptional regulator [Chromobacterium]MBK0413631.1 Com family DNA-binding transcriptional regulator [Chromobacterium haemolyticum]MBO0414733.1 Com family DNA-binding transcriptional regulator [Chromobacterium haemolyticum]MBO0497994.1 Com family DNA-binding transcriptional regulator [Chromobacterium haemolyticum]